MSQNDPDSDARIVTHRTADDDPTTHCGHDPAGRATITVHNVGRVCRRCHTPIPPHSDNRNWPEVLDESTEHHFNGGSTTFRTYFVGLDEFGRGLYHDERGDHLLTVVPLFHDAFHPDIPRDESYADLRHNMLHHRSRHGPSKPCRLSTPDQHALYVHDRTPVGLRNGTEHPCIRTRVINDAVEDGWQFISDSMLRKLSSLADRFNAQYQTDPDVDQDRLEFILDHGQDMFPFY